MTDPEGAEEDLFADLYDADESTNQPPPPVNEPPKPSGSVESAAPPQSTGFVAQSVENPQFEAGTPQYPQQAPQYDQFQNYGAGQPDFHGGQNVAPAAEPEPQGTGIKEDGKMFIGGLNWETTDRMHHPMLIVLSHSIECSLTLDLESLRDYFSEFGEVQECTVMRDSASGRSRGFGFLTFKDPKTVNTVMVKEHYLDGKIIDPKRAIPRDEQEKTSKIFVGGVSQEANEQDFKQFFMQFGRVIDATLMIDKDTGRPRGFGFVTFDSEAAVEAALSRPLDILGKPIEVKKAQPRGNLRDEEDRRRRGRDNFRDSSQGGMDGSQQQQGVQGQAGMGAGITPQMMAQYWQRMQQYFSMMQQQMAVASAQGQGMGGMGMGAMNPAMMQQMQMKQMQQMQMGNQQQGSMSPPSQSPTPQMQNMMNPAMMQQMQQMQQMQGQGQGGNVGAMPGQMGNAGNNGGGGAGGAANMNAAGNYTGNRGGPGYNAHEQIAFEQQKYEQQQARRVGDNRSFSPYQQGGPTSWEGMYDEVPQPSIPTGPQSMTRADSMGRGSTPQSQSSAPANAPTGPKNAGKPGANYRGGGRGGHRGFHPYSRS